MRRLPVWLPGVLALVLGVGSAATTALYPSVAPADEEYHRVFSGFFCGVRFFSPTSGLAVTTNGLLVTDGSPMKWKGVAGWDRMGDICYYAGGDEKTVYFVTVVRGKGAVVGDASGNTMPPPGPDIQLLTRVQREGKPVWVRNDYTFTLVRWTAATGFDNLRTLPSAANVSRVPAACTFVNANTGAFGDGSHVFVTSDAGKTWTGMEIFEKPWKVLCVVWIDSTHLVIAKDFEGTLVGLELAAGNRAQEKWRTELREDLAIYYPEPLKLSPDGKTLWVYTHYVRAGLPPRFYGINPIDGKQLRTDVPGENQGFVPTNTSLYLWRENVAKIYDLATKKIAGVATIEGHFDSVAGVIRISDHSAFLALRNIGQLVPWDERSVELPQKFLLPSTVKNLRGPMVNNRLLDEAQDRRPDWPSRREWREFQEARKAIGFNRQLEIDRERWLGDFDNYRQYVLWLTERYRKAARPHSPAVPIAPAAPTPHGTPDPAAPPRL